MIRTFRMGIWMKEFQISMWMLRNLHIICLLQVRLLIEGKDIRTIEGIEKHADWVEEWRDNYKITAKNVHQIFKDEIAKVFVKVLECVGVYKRTEEGQNAFKRFTASL